MYEAIELHDSTLAAVSSDGDTVVVSLHPAYLHRSPGKPGHDAGTGYHQPAILTFSGASPVSPPAGLPIGISDGSLRLADTLHDNLIPTHGTFAGAIELTLLLTTAKTLIVQAQRLTIRLQENPTFIESHEL